MNTAKHILQATHNNQVHTRPHPSNDFNGRRARPMTQILRDHVFLSENDELIEILVEVDDPTEEVLPIHNYGNTREGAVDGFIDKGMKLISVCAEKVSKTMTEVRSEARPTTAQVEFGIKISGQTGAFLVKGAGESHLKVTLSWHRRSDQ